MSFFGYEGTDPDVDNEATEVRCNRCGTRHLWWEERDYGRWVLTDEEGALHVCPGPSPAKPGAFSPVED